MKRQFLSAFVGFALAMLLTAGNYSPGKVEAQTSGAKSDFISNVRSFAQQRVALDDLGQSLTARYNALDLGNVLVDGDFVGNNEGVTKAQLVSVISSIAADHATFVAGHGTNYHRLK